MEQFITFSFCALARCHILRYICNLGTRNPELDKKGFLSRRNLVRGKETAGSLINDFRGPARFLFHFLFSFPHCAYANRMNVVLGANSMVYFNLVKPVVCDLHTLDVAGLCARLIGTGKFLSFFHSVNELPKQVTRPESPLECSAHGV